MAIFPWSGQADDYTYLCIYCVTAVVRFNATSGATLSIRLSYVSTFANHFIVNLGHLRFAKTASGRGDSGGETVALC